MKPNIVDLKRSISKERKKKKEKQISLLISQYENSTMVLANTMTSQKKHLLAH